MMVLVIHMLLSYMQSAYWLYNHRVDRLTQMCNIW